MPTFTQTELFTDTDGRARFRETAIPRPDGTSRTFGPGQHVLSADTLPAGATFDDKVHGHRSAQVGPTPFVTLFIKV